MIKDKKDKTMTFRLTAEDYEWLSKASHSMGSTPSKFARQLIQMAINAQKRADEEIAQRNKKVD